MIRVFLVQEKKRHLMREKKKKSKPDVNRISSKGAKACAAEKKG